MSSVEPKVNLIEKLICNLATDSRQWAVFLNELKEYLGASAILLAKSDFKNYETRIFHSVGIDYKFLRYYEGRFVNLNPWLRHEEWHIQGPVRRGEDILSTTNLTRTKFYGDWLLPQDLFYSAFAVIRELEEQIFYTLVLRPREAGPFKDHYLQYLESLIPSLQEATHRGEYLWQLAVIIDVFEFIQYAVMVVDKRGRLLFSNRLAEELLICEDGIQIRGGKVWIREQQNASCFSKTVLRVATETKREGVLDLSKVLMVPRRDNKLPLWVIVSPMTRRLRRVICQEDEVALVFVISPERVSKTSETLLSTSFNLTRAEQQLTKLILRGCRLKEAAENLGISINTARAHMKRIYDKTNTTHQTDLVRLLLTFPNV